MKLCHGSDVAIENPEIAFNKGFSDLGRGFYLTDDYDAACGRALSRARRNAASQGVVSAYRFDEESIDWVELGSGAGDSASIDGAFGLRFASALDGIVAWANYIKACRRGRTEVDGFGDPAVVRAWLATEVTMRDSNLIDRAVKASARYCELMDYEVLERNWSPEGCDGSLPIVARDGDVVVFADVTARAGCGGFAPDSETDRGAMESLAARYLAQADLEPGFRIRFDIISMMVVGESLLGARLGRGPRGSGVLRLGPRRRASGFVIRRLRNRPWAPRALLRCWRLLAERRPRTETGDALMSAWRCRQRPSRRRRGEGEALVTLGSEKRVLYYFV